MWHAPVSAPSSSRGSASGTSHPNDAAEASCTSNNEQHFVTEAATISTPQKAVTPLHNDTNNNTNDAAGNNNNENNDACPRLNVFIAMPEYVRERIRQRSTTRSRLTSGGVPPQIQQQLQSAMMQNMCEQNSVNSSALCAVPCEESKEACAQAAMQPEQQQQQHNPEQQSIPARSSEFYDGSPIHLTQKELARIDSTNEVTTPAPTITSPAVPVHIQAQDMPVQQPLMQTLETSTPPLQPHTGALVAAQPPMHCNSRALTNPCPHSTVCLPSMRARPICAAARAEKASCWC